MAFGIACTAGRFRCLRLSVTSAFFAAKRLPSEAEGFLEGARSIGIAPLCLASCVK